MLKNSQSQMGNGSVQKKIETIVNHPLRILNASVGRSYEAKFDVEHFGWEGITHFEIEGLEQTGLNYDISTKQITGVPTSSGDFKLVFKFKIEGQQNDAPLNEKRINLTINPDPKSLWKNLESDKADPYWKDDDKTEFSKISDKNILVSSKRGRSHANVGSFREDDYAFADLENGWSIVVVSDGAGSARLSRKGSEIACGEIVNHFKDKSAVDDLNELDQLIEIESPESNRKINLLVYNSLGKAVFNTHKALEKFAADEKIVIKDLAATLVFTLFKKYGTGYAFLSFGVGDCPMAVLNQDLTEVVLLNWIDVGEYGGGTRFITMPEIFHNEKFASRFTFKFIDRFAFLVLMSDGIYDPKFIVEASLPDIKKWQQFFKDLSGVNDDHEVVELSVNNPTIQEQFSAWMDFWSAGNHDDRTLAVIF